MTTLKQKSINGMFWTVSERLGLQIVGLLVSIVLARLLEPAQFGLIGMLSIFTAIAQSILDSGFGSALIQKKDANQTDASSIFFFNLFIGLILAVALYFSAPLIAQFFRQPLLISITRVLSLSLIINAFSLVQTSLLTKTMDFKTQMKVSLIATIGSGVIGISMAYMDFGVWALVAQIFSRSLFQAILLWVFNSWRPTLEFSLKSLKSMFSFGSRLLLSGLINTFFNHIYQTFIGRVFSPTDLGYYSKAKQYKDAANQATSDSLAKVLFPVLAPIQNEHIALKKAYRKTIMLSMFLHFPLMMGLWATADPLFRFLLTNKWAPSIPYFQILCIAALLHPLHSLNLNILKVKGRSDIFLRLEIVKKISVIIIIAITYRWGILGLLYGQLFNSVLSYILNSYYSGRLIDYSMINQIKDLIPSLFSSSIMGGVVYLVGRLQIESHLIKLLLQIISGVCIYFLLSLFISPDELSEAKSIVKNTLAKLHKKFKERLCQNP